MGKDFSKTLKLWSTGAEVELWQKLLKQKGYFAEEVDGVFGDKLNAATKKYQAANGLLNDGVVGKITWGFAFANVKEVKDEHIKTEVNLLAWIKRDLGPYIKKAIAGSIFTEDWLGAIAARETGFLIIRYVNKGYDLDTITKLMKGDFNNGIYHGFSFWQIDIRSFPEFINSGKWLDIQASANKAVDVLTGKMKYLKKHEEKLGEYWFSRAITAAYNCGEGNVEKAILAGKDIDSRTFNKDYSKEVFRMKEVYKSVNI
ncbi:MAG: peptidoglycan-binding protein [Ignavibacteriaceae bacterium]|jgi:hypothetical protein|nr:peptidoglycan-binding protein [Ignavibacteriaceae bacterium]